MSPEIRLKDYLDEELGTFNVGDERHGVVDGKTTGSVAMSHEG